MSSLRSTLSLAGGQLLREYNFSPASKADRKTIGGAPLLARFEKWAATLPTAAVFSLHHNWTVRQGKLGPGKYGEPVPLFLSRFFILQTQAHVVSPLPAYRCLYPSAL